MSKISRDSNIIKWYEYKMESNPDENAEDESLEASEDSLLMEDGSESLDSTDDDMDELANMEGVDPDLVADIMARFRDAKQSSVDSLFMDVNGSTEDTDTSDSTSEMSEEELIASICAPKQSNVDAFVQTANKQ